MNTTHAAKVQKIVDVLGSTRDFGKIVKEIGEPIDIMRTLAEAVAALQKQTKQR